MQDVAKQVEQFKDIAAAALLATVATKSPSAALDDLRDLCQSWDAFKDACSSATKGEFIQQPLLI